MNRSSDLIGTFLLGEARRTLWCVGTLVVGLSVSAVPGNEEPGCAAHSLLSVCRLVRRNVTQEQQAQVVTQLPSQSSLADIREAARSLGIELTGVKASLDELVYTFPRPAVVHLDHPAHFLVLLAVDQHTALVVDHARVQALPRADLQAAYSGNALVRFPPAGKRPLLICDRWVHDFGERGKGEAGIHVFGLSNVGEAPVTITGYDAGCDCVDITLSDHELAPQESAELTVVLRATGTGRFLRPIEITTDDPLTPVLYVGLQGIVPGGIRFDHDTLVLKAPIGGGDTVTARALLPAGATLEPLRDPGDMHGLAVSVAKVEENENTSVWGVTASVSPQGPPGEWDHLLRFRTSAKPEGPLVLPVRIITESAFACDPSEVFWGFVRPGALEPRVVTLSSRSGKPLQLVRATVDSPAISVSPPRSTAALSHEVKVEITTTDEGVVDGVVSLDLVTDSAAERVLLLVYAHVVD